MWLRAGKVLTCEKVPKADKLLKFSIDLNEGAPRTIVSGIAEAYTSPEVLVGKNVVVVANLKPRALNGIESRGMILTAGSGGKTLVLLDPGDVASGTEVVVHVRDALAQCIEVLRSEGLRDGMIHCFTGDTDYARAYLDLGFHLLISGVVTYKKTEALQAAVEFAPIDRLMVETDSPFLSPVPFRGKKNEPANVGETASKIAQPKNLDPDVCALRCAANSKRVLKLDVVF